MAIDHLDILFNPAREGELVKLAAEKVQETARRLQWERQHGTMEGYKSPSSPVTPSAQDPKLE